MIIDFYLHIFTGQTPENLYLSTSKPSYLGSMDKLYIVKVNIPDFDLRIDGTIEATTKLVVAEDKGGV